MSQTEYCVIDDDRDVLESICDNLRSVGSVVGFTSPEEAFYAFRDGLSPLVTIVDLKMPGLNGLDFTSQCRLQKIGGEIVLSSGNAAKSDLVRAINLGVRHFLEKPFTANYLREAVLAIAAKSDQSGQEPETKLSEIKSAPSPSMTTLLNELCEVYFERIVLIENRLMDTLHQFLDKPDDVAKYVGLQKRERQLREQISLVGSSIR